MNAKSNKSTALVHTDGVDMFYAKDRAAWRSWLMRHHQSSKSIWLIIHKKLSPQSSVSYQEAVDEALCFGWIDSKPNKLDEFRFIQFFAKRNPKSNWSEVNKNKVAQLIKAGLMTYAGMELINYAKANGQWDALNQVDQIMIPADLTQALNRYPKAEANFIAFPKSTKRGILEWILNAKKEETRAKRIEETAKLAADNIRANQYTRK